jgi:hypothetical protein
MAAEHSSSGDQIPPDSGHIEVYIRDLGQLFNSLDPSPFHEKDLDSTAEEYIVSNANELPRNAPIAITVYLEKTAGLPEDAQLLGDAIRTHFARRAEVVRLELRQLLRRGWISLAIGLTLLVSSVVVGETLVRQMGHRPWPVVIRESLLIGGWVAMWRPMEILFYDWWEVLGRQRILERLSRAHVRIVYTGKPAAETRTEAAIESAGTRPLP